MTEDQWRSRVDERLQTIDARLTTVETKNAVDEVHRANVERRLSGIEGQLVWLVRLVIGAIIAAAVSFALSGGFNV